MLCVHCEQSTSDESRCDHCGETPLVQGRYRIVSKLGQGAHGTTYKAERLEDGKVVALKELLVRNAESFKALEMFEREAAVLRQLEHWAIPAYFESFTVELGPNVGMYIAQEYVNGPTLAARTASQPLSPREVLDVIGHVGDVLGYLHGLSPPVVHRDIKPSNLIERSDGRISLIDFGSVQDALGVQDGVPTMAGTVGYMSAEQLRGHATPASDVYALGATATTLLTGMRPAEQDTDWDVALAPETRSLVKRMLAQQPNNRPTAAQLAAGVRSARAQIAELEQAVKLRSRALESLEQTPRKPPATGFVWGDSHGRAPALIALFAAVALGGPFFVIGGAVAVVGVSILGAGVIAAAVLIRKDAAARRRLRLYTDGTAVLGRVVGAASGVLYYEFDAEGRRRKGVLQAPDEFAEMKRGDDLIVLHDQKGRHHAPLAAYFVDRRRLPSKSS